MSLLIVKKKRIKYRTEVVDPENYPLYESFFSTLLTKIILHFNVLFRKFKLGKEGMKYKCQKWTTNSAVQRH